MTNAKAMTAAVVQELLSTHRVYSPLEWLIATNNLAYDDYREWRRGEKPTLDDSLLHGPRQTRLLVEHANGCAHKLDVAAATVDLYGTDENAGARLKASADERLDELLRTEFHLKDDRRQLDIFLNTPDIAAFNQLFKALAGRDAVAASKHLEELAKADVGHWAIADAATMIQALNAPSPRDPATARRLLNTMERRWRPAATAVLHAGARDFLTPLWRAIAHGLEDAAFDPAQPRQHAAWAYMQGLDWTNARRVLLAEPTRAARPELLGWLAEAHWRLRDPGRAQTCWFALCWSFPDHFAAEMENPGFPNRAMRTSWLAAQNADPPITPPWFPAWLAVEPGASLGAYEHFVKEDVGGSGPRRALQLVLALAAGCTDRQHIENRRALQALHPALLQRFLDSLD